MPPNFPKDLPLYPGAQAAQGKSMARKDGTGIGGVQLVSNDSTANIYKWYEDELAKKGLEVTESERGNPTGSIWVKNGCDSARVFVMDRPEGGSDIFFIFEGSC